MTEFRFDKTRETLFEFCDRISGINGPWVILTLTVPLDFAHKQEWPPLAMNTDHIAYHASTLFSTYPGQGNSTTYSIHASPKWCDGFVGQMLDKKMCDEGFATQLRGMIDTQVKAKRNA